MVEPKYPGAVEQYVNLGDCYDRAGLRAIRGKILTHGRLQGALSAGLPLSGRRRRDPDRRPRHAGRPRPGGEAGRPRPRDPLPGAEVKRSAPSGRVKQRFLDAVSHKGLITLFQTARAQCTRIYELSDRYGLSHLLLTHLLVAQSWGGYDVVACPDPMAPERLSHLLVPGWAWPFSPPPLPGPSRGGPAGGCGWTPWWTGSFCAGAAPGSASPKGLLRPHRRGRGVPGPGQGHARWPGGPVQPYVDFARVQEMADRVAEELLSLAWSPPDGSAAEACSRYPPRRGPEGPLISLKSQVQVHISLDPRHHPVWVYCHISKS